MSIRPSRLIANLAIGAAIALAAVPAAYARNGADDPPSHDVGDDNGGLRVGGGHGADDPATHHVGDDKGGLRDRAKSDDRGKHRAREDRRGASRHVRHRTRHETRHHHRHGRHHG